MRVPIQIPLRILSVPRRVIQLQETVPEPPKPLWFRAGLVREYSLNVFIFRQDRLLCNEGAWSCQQKVTKLGLDFCHQIVDNTSMANRIKEWRLRRGLSMQALAERVGTSRQQIHKLERGERRLTEDWMRRVAGILECEPAELLSPGVETRVGFGAQALAEARDSGGFGGAQPLSFDRNDPMPVYASAQGGPDGTLLAYEPIEFVDRPEPLFGVRNAFAMYVVSDSMEPKYSQGALLLIHPGRPVRQNDYVLIVKQAEDGDHSAMVKQLVRMEDDRLVVRQLNPPDEFEIDRRTISSVSLVIGSYEAR